MVYSTNLIDTVTDNTPVSLVTYCYGYIRVSDKSQVEQGNGLQSQEIQCREYARRNNMELLGIFKDAGKTGRNLRREGLHRVIAEMKRFKSNSQFKNCRLVLICPDVSRFGRNAFNNDLMLQEIKELGAEVIFISLDVSKLPNSLRKYLLTMAGGQAELESDINSERVTERMKSRIIFGDAIHGRAKTGYYFKKNTTRGGSIQVPHPENSKIVKHALEGYAYGSFNNAAEIATYLKKHPLVHEEGKHIGKPRTAFHDVATRIIKNAYFYAGFTKSDKHNIALCKGSHEAIINIRTFNLIEEKSSARKITPKKKADSNAYPLKDISLCASCGRGLSTNGHGSKGREKKYLYYYCMNGDCIEYKRGIKPEVIHNQFYAFLKENEIPVEQLQEAEEAMLGIWRETEKELAAERANVKRQLSGLRDKIGNMVNIIAETTDKDLLKTYQNKLLELKAEMTHSENVLKQDQVDEEDLKAVFQTLKISLFRLPQLWLEGDLWNKKIIQNLYFPEKVAYDRTQGFRKPQVWLLSGLTSGLIGNDPVLVELSGIEPLTSCMPCKRSPS